MVRSLISAPQIQWHYTLEHATDLGSLWEAAIKSCKYHFQWIVGDVQLTFDTTF